MIHIFKIILILIIAWFVNNYIGSFIKKIIKKRISEESDNGREKRIITLTSIIVSLCRICVWVVAILMVLSEAGIDIGPLLAGMGIVGLAIGFGAKKVIEDFFGGLLIIFEDQYRVGDEVKIGDVEGKVKEITLRRTIIKDSKGVSHSIPNGDIKITSNKSK